MSAYLGELEQLVMLAIAQLGDDAYGVALRDLILERTGRDVSVGAMYTTLSRLQSKGLLEAHMGEPTAQRGGRAKKIFTITGAGRVALERSLSALHSLGAELPST